MGGFREPDVRFIFSMFFCSLPGGVPRSVPNILLKHWLLFNCWFATGICICALQSCFANVLRSCSFAIPLLQFSFATVVSHLCLILSLCDCSDAIVEL